MAPTLYSARPPPVAMLEVNGQGRLANLGALLWET